MKEHEVFFSIVIPVYNRQELVKPTLDSVLNQSFTDFEILVIDDGSTDNSASVIEKYAASRPNIKLIKTQNQERGAARNTGIRAAIGNFIVFLDSDDLMHTNHLEVLNQYLLQAPETNFIATKFDFIRNGKHSPHMSLANVGNQKLDYNFFLSGNHLACNFCIKKNNPDLKLFVEDRSYAIMEDWMFLLQNLLHDTIYMVDSVTISMNDHDDRSMRSDNSRVIERRLKANQWIHDHLKLSDSDFKLLDANTYYFCAIHYYIDKNYTLSKQQLSNAIKTAGLRWNYIKLRLKILLSF